MKQINLHSPEKWNEVSAEQLRIIVELIHSGMCREDFLLALFCRLTGVVMVAGTNIVDGGNSVHTTFKDSDGNEFVLEDWQLADFCQRTAFVIEDKPRNIVCPYKWDRRLIDVSFGDWFQADALMLRYYDTKDPEFLKGAMRSLGDPHDEISPVDEELMCVWWEDFNEWLIDKYPYIFQKSDPRKESVISPMETRQNIMLMLNDRRPQDNVRIEESNLHDVLSALQYKIEEAEEMKRRFNNS